MKILVTGGTGFIGSNLINALHELGHNIISFKRRGSKPRVTLKKQPEWIVGELGDGTLTNLPNCEVVIHLAASGVKASHRKWAECVKTNIIGTNELLCGLNKISNNPLLIYPKTFYEDCLGNFHESINNPYISTKAAATKTVELWANTNKNIKVTFGTIFQCYGPGDDPGNVITYTIDCLRNDTKVKLGSGIGMRDWIYIDDLINAIVKTINLSIKRIQYYDFGTGELTSLKEMVNIIADMMGRSKELLNFDPKMDRTDTEFSAHARDFVPDWKPYYSNLTGIKKCLQYTEK